MTIRAADRTRASLLAAAFSEIHRQGYQAASIVQILADTGLTRGALYHHFPSKHTLGLAVIDEVIWEHLEATVFRPLRDAECPVPALLGILEAKTENLDDASIRLGCPLNNLIQEMSPVDADFRQHLALVLRGWQSALQSALETGQRQGHVRLGVDCEAAALFILAAWEGCWGVAKNQQSVATFRACVSELRDYVRRLGAEVGATR